jgi:hypothetical protein
VDRGRAEFDVPRHGPGSRTLVIVSTLARGPGPFPIRLEARPAAKARVPVAAPPAPRRDVRLKPAALEPPPEPAPGRPESTRWFHLLVRDGDAASASNYLAIRGQLRAVGQRVQVYVDAQDLALVGGDLLSELVTTFDTRVFPTAAATFGRACDVDGDGRFTVLLSNWLTRLAGGRHAVDGYVRAADFDATLAAPFGNRCDMMYLSTALEPGPHLRTVVAHEYTHAVTLSSKAFADRFGGGGGSESLVVRPHLEEEGWLDEALAHLVEDLHGFSRSNLDYRISAFLSQPARYRLVVEDYYAADLFRSHGNRGGTYLFLRWCADRFGPTLLPVLIRSEMRGTANVEAATGVPFAELYRQWTVALCRSGLALAARDAADAFGGEGDPPADYRSIDLRRPLGEWELAGPRPLEATPGGAPVAWSATGTSSQFVVVETAPGTSTGPGEPAAAAAAIAVSVSGPPEAQLQVTALPLPSGLARTELAVRVVGGPEGSRRLDAWVQERQGVAVELTGLAWEPLVPAANPRTSGFHRGRLGGAALARAFGTTALPPHGTLFARGIVLPDTGGPLVIKLVGTDAGGHRVAAWAELPAAEP